MICKMIAFFIEKLTFDWLSSWHDIIYNDIRKDWYAHVVESDYGSVPVRDLYVKAFSQMLIVPHCSDCQLLVKW